MKRAAWLRAKPSRTVKVKPLLKEKLANETVRRPARKKGAPEIEKIITRKVSQVIGYEAVARDGRKVWRAHAATEQEAVTLLESQLG